MQVFRVREEWAKLSAAQNETEQTRCTQQHPQRQQKLKNGHRTANQESKVQQEMNEVTNSSATECAGTGQRTATHTGAATHGTVTKISSTQNAGREGKYV